ncbi:MULTISPECIES: sulfate ABC transporter permease subunit CysW [Bacillaceae]|uniref:Sulfate ABC transporter permease subunit CysW n=1 Tax=Gottfriedia luciferensis TaxID=178774 RepID=A0ABX2ZNQ9_9BACI|nr:MULTISPECIES: sulfate ABC transporter permease subunit CysW [Bacillaceae]ODG91358.1 sulfate ABC transporter permease subunit CysW [Gottfriedia luciferensis]PGZ92022.1 sulfate ABC transporter permease subunit CysW [Bacillus sp. AFS029533]SFD57783.1 sulfate transport system permease protein [Bacillus sp. UNCCL81]
MEREFKIVRELEVNANTDKRAKLNGNTIQIMLISIVILFLALFLFLPLVSIFIKALQDGFGVYKEAIVNDETLAAIKLTFLVTIITLPLNAIFGVSIAWATTKFNFKGKNILVTLIELPFAVSPVVAGFLFVLLFSPNNGIFGGWLKEHNLKIIFSTPGIVLATIFVTLPFVAKELIAVMQATGSAEEEAALTLGANGWHIFWKVTLPKIKWGLLYGVILCNARAVGEFGAVSVVSGHIRGETITMPLQIENLYNEYQFPQAYTVASLMSIFAILTLVIKNIIEWKVLKEEKQ